MNDLLEAIRRSVEDRGYPPTIRELADQFGLAVGTVHARLVKLETEGRIVRGGKGAPRAIRIVEEGDSE